LICSFCSLVGDSSFPRFPFVCPLFVAILFLRFPLRSSFHLRVVTFHGYITRSFTLFLLFTTTFRSFVTVCVGLLICLRHRSLLLRVGPPVGLYVWVVVCWVPGYRYGTVRFTLVPTFEHCVTGCRLRSLRYVGCVCVRLPLRALRLRFVRLRLRYVYVGPVVTFLLRSVTRLIWFPFAVRVSRSVVVPFIVVGAIYVTCWTVRYVVAVRSVHVVPLLFWIVVVRFTVVGCWITLRLRLVRWFLFWFGCLVSLRLLVRLRLRCCCSSTLICCYRCSVALLRYVYVYVDLRCSPLLRVVVYGRLLC